MNIIRIICVIILIYIIYYLYNIYENNNSKKCENFYTKNNHALFEGDKLYKGKKRLFKKKEKKKELKFKTNMGTVNVKLESDKYKVTKQKKGKSDVYNIVNYIHDFNFLKYIKKKKHSEQIKKDLNNYNEFIDTSIGFF